MGVERFARPHQVIVDVAEVVVDLRVDVCRTFPLASRVDSDPPAVRWLLRKPQHLALAGG